jgi:hypothetical protein
MALQHQIGPQGQDDEENTNEGEARLSKRLTSLCFVQARPQSFR